MNLEIAKATIIEFGRRLYRRGLIAGTDGNLSVMTSEGSIVITASGSAKGFLGDSDLVVVDNDGQVFSGKRGPSSELAMHLTVYRHRPAVGACCHAHPAYATALAVTGQALPGNILPEAVLSVGEVALAPYAPTGTEAVGKSLEPFLDGHEAFILGNHGVLTIGATMEEAYNRMETVEHLARIVLISRGFGETKFLDDSEMDRLRNIRED